MRTTVRIVLGFLGVSFLALAAVSYFQQQNGIPGDIAIADEFTKALNIKDIDKAYSYLSREFANNTTKQDLQEYLEKNAISGFSNVTTWSRAIRDEHRILTGFATSDDDYVVPVEISLTQEGDTWKIYSLRASTRVPKMPSEEELLQLVSDSTHIFAISVNEKSMAKFYGHVSNLWRNNTTIENFDKDFGAFYEAGIDLTALREQTPHFDPKPIVDQNGHLILSGAYPTTPVVQFQQQYLFEDGKWRLISFSMTI